jgi:hypothetical protein
MARRYGVHPSWSVGAESWCVEALALEPDGIAILGTSRILSGVEPDELSRLTGRRARQLAINATSMLPILEWLAAQPDFAGTVVAEVTPYLEFRAGFEGHTTAERFLRDLEDFRRSPGRRVDSQLSRFLQTRLACRSPGFHLLAPYRDRHGPGIRRLKSLTVEATRFTRLEFEAGDEPAEGHDAGPTMGVPAGKAELDRLINRFASAARAIQERGGRVVFLCMPSGGKVEEREERVFPRKDYWERLAAATTAEAIHSSDMPTLAAFPCPDGEHLDYRDALRFTRALAEVLKARR